MDEVFHRFKPTIVNVALTICLILASGSRMNAQFVSSRGYDWSVIGGTAVTRIIYGIKESKFERSKPYQGKGVPDILWFDRSALGNSSYKAANTSDWFLYSSLGGMALGGVHTRQGWYLGLQTMAITDLTNLLLKNIVKRRRPFTYHNDLSKPDQPFCRKYDARKHDASLSFYSGHTAQVATFSYFTLSMFWYTSPSFHNGGNEWVYILGGSIPSLTAYLRVRAGKHFPTDVIVGYLAGAAAGYFIPKWHRDKSEVGSVSDLDEKLGLALISGAGSGIILAVVSKMTGKPKHNCLDGSDLRLSQSNRVDFSVKPQIGIMNGMRMTLTF